MMTTPSQIKEGAPAPFSSSVRKVVSYLESLEDLKSSHMFSVATYEQRTFVKMAIKGYIKSQVYGMYSKSRSNSEYRAVVDETLGSIPALAGLCIKARERFPLND